MPAYDPSFFNVDPYYNDFDEQKKYLKLLFRPGFALQARELSQIQSILQNQIERFGNFVFNDGSIVYGGQVTEIPTFVSSISGFSGVPIDTLSETVLELSNEESDDPSYAKVLFSTRIGEEDYIYYQFLSGESLTANGTSLSGSVGGVPISGTLEDFYDNAMVVFVDEGIRYTNGYFVYHEPQKIGLFENEETPTFSNVTKSVGFRVEKDIVTSERDSSLLDPASGSFNFNAPGSDRFKIDLVIDQRNLTPEDLKSIAINPFSRTDFIEFLRVVDGNVVKREKYPELGALEETFARRTYDESGHYIVNPFELTMKTNSDPEKLTSKLDSGKAYIFGYEFETQGSVELEHDKARETKAVTKIPFGYPIGSYIIAEFSGLSSGLTALGFTGPGNTIRYPRILFDSSSGATVEPEFGLRFEVDEVVDTNTFVPGMTLYFHNAFEFDGLAPDTTPSGELRSLQIFSDYSLFETGPFSQEELNQILTFGSPVFVNTYDDAGETWGNAVTGGEISQFNIVSPSSITGGALENQIGSSRVFNIQRQSGNRYKLFLSDTQFTPPFRVSDARRLYLEGATSDPTFFLSEFSPRIYNAGSDSRVFSTRFDEVVDKFNEMDFIVDVFYNNLPAPQGNRITIDKETFAKQIGPNVSCNSSPVSLKNCSFATLYDDIGELEGTYTLEDCDANGEANQANPKKITIDFSGERPPSGNIRAIISQQVELSTTDTRQKSSVDSVEATLTGSSSERFFIHAGKILTDVYKVHSVSGLSPSQYIFDDGQRSTHYDFSRITFSGEIGATATVSYYNHSSQGPFLGGTSSQSSYPNYEEIPDFTDNSGRRVSLRSSIDFRPVRIGSLNEFSLTGPYAKPTAIFDGYDHSSDYEYYLPRMDKVILSRNKRFRVLEGIASDFPVPPNDDADSMTLYTLVFNPYTFDENDVTILQEDNRRFTMKDIGTLEKRIESIEKYTTLTLLEQEAKNTPIFDDMGLEVPKKAILTDQFQSNGNGDILNQNFRCSVERESNELRPAFNTEFTAIQPTDIGGMTNSDGIVHFPIVEENPFIENVFGNNYRKVNSNIMIDFLGSVKLTPYADKWFDDNTQAIVKNNSNGDNNSWLLGEKSYHLDSNFWDHNWFGKEINILEKEFKKNFPRRSEVATKELSLGGKLGSFTNPLSSVESVNEKVVDRSIVPYCRERVLTLNAKFLKPETTHYLFFDGTEIPSGATTSNEFGEINGLTFSIPSGTFPTGKKVVRIADVENPNEISKATSSGDAIYYASGIIKDSESQNYIRPLIHRRESSNSENITNDVLVREAQRAGRKSRSLRDPLTQMFTVDSERYRSGLFVTSVELYFDSFPASGIDFNLPVRVQLRPSVNGYPSPSRIIAESIVGNSGISAGDNFTFDNSGIDAKKVKFEFDYPVYLVPGDYALTVESNSDLHSIVTYVLPSTSNNTLDEDKTNFVDPMLGSLFLPKNTGRFEEVTNEFLSLNLNRATFDAGSSSKIITVEGLTPSSKSQIRSSLEGIFPSSSKVSLNLSSNDKSPINKTVDITNIDATNNIEINLNSDNPEISPCVDTQSSAILTSEYQMEGTLDLEKELKPVILDSSDTGSRYMTKNLTLLSPAKNLRVIFDKNQPSGTQIEVFAKCLEVGSTKSMDEVPYRRLSPIGGSLGSSSGDSFLRSEYTLRGFVPDFSTFSVKIVFYSSGKSYPRVRNLRVIAT